MHPWPRKTSLWQKPRYIPLRYRFILFTTLLLILLIGIIAAVVSYQQSRIIRDHVERRGLAIAQSLAAASVSDLTTYNYIALSRSANQAAQDPDLVYVIIHDKEGRAAAFSGHPELQGTFLQDSLSLKAISSQNPLAQTALSEDGHAPILDVAVPVSIPGSKRIWGVVRVALSLAPMYRQLHQVQFTIGAIGFVALAVGVLMCIWLARRITNPLGHLVKATITAAQGDLEQEIHIKTADEVELLADNFSIMIREILGQRQQLERQLSEITRLQRYLNKLLTTMNDGLLTVNMKGEIVTLNPAAGSLLIHGENEIHDETPAGELLRDAPELLAYIRDALENPYSAGQKELRIPTGQEAKTAIVASSVLVDNRGNPQQIIINLHDVTDLKKLEARYRQAERLAALGTLAAGMAHEIRNPLSAIKTFVQLLPRKVDKPGFLDKFNRTVPRELERINRLIGDLLELARTPKYRFEWIDIKLILQHTIDLFEEEMNQNHVRCRLDFRDESPWVWADTDQITKAFNNLIQNAIQSMPEGGELTIQASTARKYEAVPDSQDEPSETIPRHYLSLTFTDTGMGISSEDLPNIFNPFFTTKDTGTGLGLAITHKVITEHDGLIEVESLADKGARFIVHLPALEASETNFSQTSAVG